MVGATKGAAGNSLRRERGLEATTSLSEGLPHSSEDLPVLFMRGSVGNVSSLGCYPSPSPSAQAICPRSHFLVTQIVKEIGSFVFILRVGPVQCWMFRVIKS